MSEQKKVLFAKPGTKVAQDHQKRAHEQVSEQVESVDLRADTKNELYLVLVVCLIVTGLFAGIFFTDRTKPWIEEFSIKLTSKLISGF